MNEIIEGREIRKTTIQRPRIKETLFKTKLRSFISDSKKKSSLKNIQARENRACNNKKRQKYPIDKFNCQIYDPEKASIERKSINDEINKGR